MKNFTYFELCALQQALGLRLAMLINLQPIGIRTSTKLRSKIKETSDLQFKVRNEIRKRQLEEGK